MFSLPWLASPTDAHKVSALFIPKSAFSREEYAIICVVDCTGSAATIPKHYGRDSPPLCVERTPVLYLGFKGLAAPSYYSPVKELELKLELDLNIFSIEGLKGLQILRCKLDCTRGRR
jgi:hypothetical protein